MDTLYGIWDIYTRGESVDTKLCETGEDGIEFGIEYEDSEIIGADGYPVLELRTRNKPKASWVALKWNKDTLQKAIPTGEYNTDTMTSNIEITTTQKNLMEQGIVYVLKKRGGTEEDVIVFWNAINVAAFTTAFKNKEASTLPFELKAYPDSQGRLVTIGDATITA